MSEPGRRRRVARAPWILLLALAGGCAVVRAPNVRDGTQQTAAGRASYPLQPTWEESDEATLSQLRLAKAQGDAEKPALDRLRRDAIASAHMPAGEYDVTLFVQPPMGWYDAPGAGGGALAWHDAPTGGAHVSVVVRDAADGRTVAGVGVRLTVTSGGAPASTDSLPFGWYPELNRYGANVDALGPGTYTFRVELTPPSYDRHDPTNGDRYAQPAMAEFTDVRVGAIAPAAALDTAAAGALARIQGDAVADALYTMLHGVAVFGAEQRSGDYLVAFADEFAETFWKKHGDDLRYALEEEESNAHNAHVEVGVRDARTGRFLPGLNVRVTVTAPDGHRAGSSAVALMWHPWLYHYGMNWRIPGASDHYTVQVHADPPSWRRYGRESGSLFAQPIDLDFTSVRFRTGQK